MVAVLVDALRVILRELTAIRELLDRPPSAEIETKDVVVGCVRRQGTRTQRRRRLAPARGMPAAEGTYERKVGNTDTERGADAGEGAEPGGVGGSTP
jgi:hypothetical protein